MLAEWRGSSKSRSNHAQRIIRPYLPRAPQILEAQGDARMMKAGSFVLDVKEIRKRAREHMEQGAVTSNYEGDVETTIKILNDALATEIVCVLRYKFHSIAAQGNHSDSVKEEFASHATEEQEHADMLAERINQLGGKPNFNPDGLLTRSATQYVEGDSLVGMIRENLIAE